MASYRVDLAYIGTNFTGWQTQPGKTSIQDHLEKALSTFLRHKVTVIGSSRTDSGVHAEHQVATFKSLQTFDFYKLQKGCNALLPKDIQVQRISVSDSSFHPIASSKAKLYRYRIWVGQAIDPFARGFSWQVHNLNLDLVEKAIPFFIGKHNFKSFCASDSNVKTFDRNVLDIKLQKFPQWIDVYVLGEGFLKQMVRNIIGTMVDVGLSKFEVNEIYNIILKQDRTAAGRTAPAQGLSLVKIYFGDSPDSIDLSYQDSFGFQII